MDFLAKKRIRLFRNFLIFLAAVLPAAFSAPAAQTQTYKTKIVEHRKRGVFRQPVS
jgi:hypothetical protein